MVLREKKSWCKWGNDNQRTQESNNSFEAIHKIKSNKDCNEDMTHQHAQHITSFTLLRRRVQGVYITKVYLLVCECVILKYSKLANEINNTSIKNQSVLVPCSVLLVQIRLRVFWGSTNDNAPRNMNLLSRKYILIHV